jgi:phosphoribosylaminoimidazole (AIR) synthetase
MCFLRWFEHENDMEHNAHLNGYTEPRKFKSYNKARKQTAQKEIQTEKKNNFLPNKIYLKLTLSKKMYIQAIYHTIVTDIKKQCKRSGTGWAKL